MGIFCSSTLGLSLAVATLRLGSACPLLAGALRACRSQWLHYCCLHASGDCQHIVVVGSVDLASIVNTNDDRELCSFGCRGAQYMATDATRELTLPQRYCCSMPHTVDATDLASSIDATDGSCVPLVAKYTLHCHRHYW